jgi:hypothetical protein
MEKIKNYIGSIKLINTKQGYIECIDHLYETIFLEKSKNILKEMDNKRIFELVQNLGLALSDYEHIWSNELRKEYEGITNYLQSN